uniref:Tumor necrosis factor ligand superfamily member 13B n=2 Tax=Lygus hesperus TaxID=30085 RepID=A0A0A9YLE0_LYGHE
MLSDHGWTMLKPQPEPSSTTYCYVHPGDPETSEGDSNVHRTRIKLSNGIIPSHIKVDVLPKKKVFVESWSIILVLLLLFTSYVLLAMLYFELKTTKSELKTLENLIKSLGKWEPDEVPRSGMSVASALINQNSQDTRSTNAGDPTTVSPPASSTERDKREADSFMNHGFPLLAHYKGGLPESVVNEGGLISPWFKDKYASGEFALKNTTFKEAKGSVVVPEAGLYFIYAQVYYLTRNVSNSYSITLKHESGLEIPLATCSSPPNEQGESSCYTATARALKKDDKLQLRQRERNRHILLRQGQTFLGLVLLSPSPSFK